MNDTEKKKTVKCDVPDEPSSKFDNFKKTCAPIILRTSPIPEKTTAHEINTFLTPLDQNEDEKKAVSCSYDDAPNLARNRTSSSQCNTPRFIEYTTTQLLEDLDEEFDEYENEDLNQLDININVIKKATVSQTSILRGRTKVRLLFDLGLIPIKCKECNVGIELLFALQPHHTSNLKEITLRKLPYTDYNLALEKFKNEKIEFLCVNHHREKNLFFPLIFKDLIFKKDLFLMSTEEIDKYIDNYLLAFSKTNEYDKNVIFLKCDYPLSSWKYQIKRWLKKRFVFEKLFDLKCIGCGDSNLVHLELHHIDPNSKEDTPYDFWHYLSKFDCDEIMHRLINEKCVSLCSNCHSIITYKYHLSAQEILKDFYTQQEINKIVEIVKLKYQSVIDAIADFKYPLNIDFYCPLKFEFPRKENIWKIHLILIYYYLEIKKELFNFKKSFFFMNEILYDLELTRQFSEESIKILIAMNYIQKINHLLSLTEKGKSNAFELTEKYPKKVESIKRKIKYNLSSKGQYEFLSYHLSKDNKFLKKINFSKEEKILKYCLIINDFVLNKGVNEFTTKEITSLIYHEIDKEIKEKSKITVISSDFQNLLLPLGIVEEVFNSISYTRIHPNKEISDTRYAIGLNTKVYKFTDKGFNIIKEGFTSLNDLII